MVAHKQHVSGNMASTFSVILLVTSLLFSYPDSVYAYEQDCTHPVLSERAAELYQLHYGQMFSPTAIKRLKEGATHEDNGSKIYVRSTNHFYDIHNHRPWTNYGILIKNAPCIKEAIASSYIRTSKEWALNSAYQKITWKSGIFDCDYGGDYSWPKILESLDAGSSTDDMSYAAGHILHLLQDLTVPAHTRNDTHLRDLLELYAKDACNWMKLPFTEKIPSAESLYQSGLKPVELSKIDFYFDELSQYTYSHYYSNDTRFSTMGAEYDAPIWTRRGTEKIGALENTFLYGTDSSSVKYQLPAEYKLLHVNTWMEAIIPDEKDLIYTLSKECLSDYWQRLMRKAIAYSAGALKKLSDEATARGKCFPSCPTMNLTPCTGKPDKRYCGSSLSGYTGNASDLVTCRGGMPLGNSACPNGCQSNPPGTDDTCKTGPCTTYYLDQDGDGHGDKFQPGKCQMGPSAPYTAVTNDDCSDTDRDVYPGHTEWWDVKDNDCDGSIDEDGLLRYDRWHKEWTPTDLEHRFSVSSPGSGFTKESRWLQLYPTDVCSGGYKAPGCNPIRSGVYAEVRSGVQLAALGECTGQFRSAPFAHVTLYLLEDSTEYNDYATGIVPGFACRRFGYVLGSGATAAFFGKKAFNRLRSKFDVGGRYDNMWSTDLSEVNHSDYATSRPEDTRHWYAPDGL